jgi:hypothetical protein
VGRVTITPEQARQQLVRMGDPRAIKRVLTNALRRTATGIRKGSMTRFRSRGVGRRIFGTKKFRMKHSKGLLSVSRARDRGTHVELDVTAKGFAAIQESGGRTAPHVIKAKNAPLLVFRVPGGLVKAKEVQHPGATHPRMPHLGPAVREGTTVGTREIEAAMEGHIDRALR